MLCSTPRMVFLIVKWNGTFDPLSHTIEGHPDFEVSGQTDFFCEDYTSKTAKFYIPSTLRDITQSNCYGSPAIGTKINNKKFDIFFPVLFQITTFEIPRYLCDVICFSRIIFPYFFEENNLFHNSF